MKIKVGYTEYVEKEIKIPKKYNFVITKDEEEWTKKERKLADEFYDWMLKYVRDEEWELIDYTED